MAAAATGVPASIVPLMTVPGGLKPVTEAAGNMPRLPLTMVGPVLLTVGVPASTAKLPEVPRGGGVEASAPAGQVTPMKPTIHMSKAAIREPLSTCT